MKNKGTHVPFFCPECRIEMTGSSRVTVDGCRGVAFCSDEHIRLSIGSRYVAINGSELIITSMFGAAVTVEGIISGVEFI